MDDGRKLEKIMVRYFPPGIILEFKDYDGYIDNKSIDLLNLSENSDIPYLVQQINEKEPLTIKYKSKIHYLYLHITNLSYKPMPPQHQV